MTMNPDDLFQKFSKQKKRLLSNEQLQFVSRD